MAAEHVTVRAADLESAPDVRKLAALRWEWRLARGGQPPHPFEHFVADLGEWCRAHRDSHRAFLAETVDAAVGMAWYGAYDRVPGPELWFRRSGAIQSVYVQPDHRGGGTGGRLIDAVLDAARAEGLDHLLLHPTEPSVPLYLRHGFAPRDRAMEIDLKARRNPIA